MTHVRGEPDLSNCEIDLVLIAEGFTPIELDLPHMWAFPPDPSDGIGGPAVADPAMLRLYLPVGEDEDDPWVFETSLEAVIDDFIESLASPVSGKIEVDRHLPAGLATRLRELADKIDAACSAAAPG